MTFLVTAATGRTSSVVVRHLRAAGEDVRVLVRNREKAQSAFSDLDGIEIVDGAFDDGAVLAKAFNGVDVTFLTIGGNPDQVRLEMAIIDAAAKADCPHVVKLSSIATSHDSALLPGRQHAEIEDYLAASGLSHTLLRPVSFTDNLLYAAESVAAHNSWAGGAPIGRVAYIDIRDVSEAAALVLCDPTLHGGTHDWSGPDAYTFPEAAALLSKILGREIRYVPVPADERRSALLGAGLAKWYAELFVSLDTAAEAGALQAVTTTLKELLGREPRTVEEFLTENATQFTK